MTLSKTMKILTTSIALLACADVSATATPVNISGQVSQDIIVGSAGGAPGNYDFRVFLQGNPAQCNGVTWSFVNTNDANYQAIVASIYTARSLGVPVTLSVIQTSTGYCQIGSVTF